MDFKPSLQILMINNFFIITNNYCSIIYIEFEKNKEQNGDDREANLRPLIFYLLLVKLYMWVRCVILVKIIELMIV